jgi:hypothetical protein
MSLENTLRYLPIAIKHTGFITIERKVKSKTTQEISSRINRDTDE